jgi:hypothetical protein
MRKYNRDILSKLIIELEGKFYITVKVIYF